MYSVVSCVRTSTDVEGPLDMHVEVEGEYEHSLIEALGHTVTSKAIALAYEDMPDVFDQDCSEDGVAFHLGQGFECELYWELVGYN